MFSPSQLAEAVAYNIRKATTVGWAKNYQVVSATLGFGMHEPTPSEFAAAVYQWQLSYKPVRLGADGKLGPKTFRAMQMSAVRTGGRPKPPAWVAPSKTGSIKGNPVGVGPRWVQYALGEMNAWDAEIATWNDKDKVANAELHMTRDEEYFSAAPYFGGKTKPRGTKPKNKLRRHWCAAFVNWCLHAAGYSHTGSAGAHSFITPSLWRFDALEEPKMGCVIVVGNGKRASHVGFLWNSRNLPKKPNGNVLMTGNRILSLLGGNQSQRVNIRPEPKRLLACRGQNKVTSPYLWPRRGAPNCNHDPSTEAAHFCGRIHSD